MRAERPDLPEDVVEAWLLENVAVAVAGKRFSRLIRATQELRPVLRRDARRHTNAPNRIEHALGALPRTEVQRSSRRLDRGKEMIAIERDLLIDGNARLLVGSHLHGADR